MTSGLPITCFHNPSVGRERELPVLRATTPRHVLVVGGGPAGLIAAETAAAAGHRVTLAEATSQLGGRLRYVLELGRARELFSAVDWLVDSLAALDVDVRLDTRVGAELLDALAPDAVVVATGAVHDGSGLDPGDGTVPVVSPDAALDLRRRAPVTGDVLVVDTVGTQEVALLVEALATDGASVTWATPALSPGWAVGFTLLKDLLQVVADANAQVETSTVFVRIAGGRVATRHVYRRSEVERPFDLVVAGTAPVAAPGDLRELAAARGLPVVVAGDAVAPRNAMLAFREGFDAARSLAGRLV